MDTHNDRYYGVLGAWLRIIAPTAQLGLIRTIDDSGNYEEVQSTEYKRLSLDSYRDGALYRVLLDHALPLESGEWVNVIGVGIFDGSGRLSFYRPISSGERLFIIT